MVAILHCGEVITGIFIQQTMRVANEDDELLLLQKKRLVDSHAKGVTWRLQLSSHLIVRMTNFYEPP